MSAVYVVGVAVLAWRRYHLADIWALILALNIMLVLCLDILVVIAHVFVMLIPPQPKLSFLITESIVMLLFVVLGIFTARKYRASQAGRTVQPMVNGCN
jgi:Mn2+/Fe2+ NRAMP family transporter